MRPFGILVNSINPGVVSTNLGNHIGERFQKDHPFVANVLVKSGVFGTFYSLLTGIMWTPEDAALTQVMCDVCNVYVLVCVLCMWVYTLP